MTIFGASASFDEPWQDPGGKTDWRSPSTSTPGWVVDDGPDSYHRPDEFILDDIAKLLASDPDVSSVGLEIRCKDGVVSVGGAVESYDVRQRVEMLIAAYVIKVREVQFDMPGGAERKPRPDHAPPADVDKLRGAPHRSATVPDAKKNDRVPHTNNDGVPQTRKSGRAKP
jgi:hypothetical protein